MKFEDLSGTRFGKLTVLNRVMDNERHTKWSCQCDCGKKTTVIADNLKKGVSRSCGCIRNELVRQRSLKHGATINRIHSREYRAWCGAKERCYNENSERYPIYGGRGIKICSEWKNNFSTFFKDMGYCPEKLTLERIDVNGDYEPKNCKWASATAQQHNMRKNVWLTYNGITMIQADWARYLGVDIRLFGSWRKNIGSMENIIKKYNSYKKRKP